MTDNASMYTDTRGRFLPVTMISVFVPKRLCVCVCVFFLKLIMFWKVKKKRNSRKDTFPSVGNKTYRATRLHKI